MYSSCSPLHFTHSPHHLPPTHPLTTHLLSLPLLHVQALLSQTQSLPKVYHLLLLLLQQFFKLSYAFLKASDLPILVVDPTVSPAEKETQTRWWREEN